MEEYIEYVHELYTLKTNLKKSINKIFSRKYINEKLDRIEFIRNRINEINDTEELIQSKQRIVLLCKEVEEILKALKTKKVDIKESLLNMAQFDISVVGKNLQVFKGAYKYLDDFLSQTELLHDLVIEEERHLFIKYVYNFKLTSQVRSTLGRSSKPTTYVELKKILIESYPNPRTLQQVLTELGTTNQGNTTISEFREQISELADQLSAFEINSLTKPSQETKDAIYTVSDNMALNVFVKGVNPEYQTILLSNPPTNINEAVQRCLSAEKSFGNDNKNVYAIKKRNYNDRYRSSEDTDNRYNDERKNYNNYKSRERYNEYRCNCCENNRNNSRTKHSNYYNNRNYRNNNNNSGYNSENRSYNNGKQNDRNTPQYNQFNNRKDNSFKTFAYEEQGNCHGRMTEEVVHEGQM